ncbi:S-methyl-5-thioribose kinase [Ammoniphilus sp. YIM 78166]|uniref:S-methyl-5-thioribose kinase n=1 Tax=Ammoniphilus sp. YIM 78166 TaxID=1644106 RepID=UPI00107051D3|nr:S-methyl-5-thioribose kinase [Ammoniphilus sp. YIM 78166]
MEYRAFSEQEAVEYARHIKGLFPDGAQLDSREIGDGNLNLVFHIIDRVSGKSIIFKQALPYARVVGESWPLTLDRARIESEALIIQDEICPGSVPKVYHYDKELALTVMEDLSDHVIMRKGLIEGNLYPAFAEHIGSFLAKTLFFTSDYAMGFKEKKERVGQFINPELCKITEDLVFTDPYYDAETNNFNPLIRETVEGIWGNAELRREIGKLKYSFMTDAQALLHGDLHTGSIMVTEQSTKVIDPEFAYYGPMGFDIGAVIANLLLNYAAQEGLKENAAERGSFRAWLLGTATKVWNTFEEEFRRLYKENVKDPVFSAPGFVDDVMAGLLKDTAGFAGCKMMRRVIGLAGVADLNSIQDEKVRAKAEIFALAIGQSLVMERQAVKRIEDVLEIVKKIEE